MSMSAQESYVPAPTRLILQGCTWHEDETAATPVAFGKAEVYDGSDWKVYLQRVEESVREMIEAPAPDDPEHVYLTLTLRVDRMSNE